MDDFTITKIKEAADIVDVMNDFNFEFHRAGNSGLTCLCPFHEDRHLGNFKVSRRRNIFHCFACGETGGPVDFLMKYEGLTFIEAMEWLAHKYSIDVEGADKWKNVKPSKPRPPQPPLPDLKMLVLPNSMPRDLMRNAEKNTLVRWLDSLPWDGNQRRRLPVMLRNYAVGDSKNGHTIWWQIDENKRVRTGKMMLYKNDGHRNRDKNSTWVHATLQRIGYYNPDEYEMRQCLFGLHLLNLSPNATINIVESEKTALICAIAYGNMQRGLWMATGGMENLKREMLQPLIDQGRYIVLYPDHDGLEKWTKAAADIGYSKLSVNTSFMETYWRGRDGEKADIADVLVRMICDRARVGMQTITEAMEQHPAVGPLIEKLNLKPINATNA